jgi:carboxymethylenebutenolidase
MKKIVSLLCMGSLSILLFAQSPKERLENSPRHQEWLKLTHDNRSLDAFLVYPESSQKVEGIIVIHENRGLNDWARSMTDQLAEKGYIAIAPDLLSGLGPGGGKTSDFPSSDAAREALYQLDPDQITSDLNAAYDYLKKLKSCNGKIVVIGFCWGGSQTFRYATNQSGLEASFVCYGRAPAEGTGMDLINAPVYGFYGGNDERVNASLEATEMQMKGADKTFDPVIYPGAGHGFMRSGEAADATPQNKQARSDAWQRLLGILGSL